MQFKSASFAKALLVLALGIASTSVYFGRQWNEQLQAQRSTISKAEKDAQGIRSALEQMKTTLSPDATPVKLETGLSALMLDVFNRRVAHSVTITAATPAKLGSGGNINKLDALVEEVPGTALQSVRVNLTGTYETYTGLLEYLKALQKHPVALVRLKVQDQNFEVALRLYGTMN